MDDEVGIAYPTASVHLGWLAFRGLRPRGVPNFAELGLMELAEECRQWQHLRSAGDLWEFNSLKAGRPDSWREIAQLMGSVGESVVLAAGAEVEVEMLRRAITSGRVDHKCALAQRFFAEGESHLLLGAAHRLGNICLRALMLAPGYPWAVKLDRIPDRPVEPYSDARQDWIPFSATPQLRRLSSKSGYPSLIRLAGIVTTLKSSPAWGEMERQRDLDFHRAREESPVATGTSRSPAWKRTGPGQRTLSSTLQPDLTRDQTIAWVEPICAAPRGLLDQLGPVMVDFRETVQLVISDIAGGGQVGSLQAT